MYKTIDGLQVCDIGGERSFETISHSYDVRPRHDGGADVLCYRLDGYGYQMTDTGVWMRVLTDGGVRGLEPGVTHYDVSRMKILHSRGLFSNVAAAAA